MQENRTETLTITIPENIEGNIEGFRFLAYCLKTTYTIRGNIVFDFTINRHFELSLTAMLGIIVKIANERNLSCTLRNVNQYLKKMWERNGFLYYFIKMGVLTKGKNREKDVEKYLEVREEHLHEVVDYIKNNFLSAKECPKMSELLKNEMVKSILELVINAHEHGGKKYAILCGHNSLNEGKLCFCVSNIGNTFKDNISEFLKDMGKTLPSDYYNHIDWAANGQTTKKETGGLGLLLLREFIKKNNGCIHICSDSEYWIQDKNGYISHDILPVALMGSLVYIEINIQDEKKYSLVRETS